MKPLGFKRLNWLGIALDLCSTLRSGWILGSVRICENQHLKVYRTDYCVSWLVCEEFWQVAVISLHYYSYAHHLGVRGR